MAATGFAIAEHAAELVAVADAGGEQALEREFRRRAQPARRAARRRCGRKTAVENDAMLGSVLPASDSTGVSTSSTLRVGEERADGRVESRAQAQGIERRRRSQSVRRSIATTARDSRADSARNASSFASSQISTPSSCAFASLLPAASPATTKLVFFDTLPDDLRAECFELRTGFVARHRFQASGQHDGLAGERTIAGALRRAFLPVHAGCAQRGDDLAVMRLGEEMRDVRGDDRTDVGHRASARLRRRP